MAHHVQVVIHRDHHKPGAFLPGGKQGFPGLDAVLLRRDGFGQHDPMPACLIAADNAGYIPEIHRCPVLQAVCRLPAQICRVDIDMHDDSVHGNHLNIILYPNICSCKLINYGGTVFDEHAKDRGKRGMGM